MIRVIQSVNKEVRLRATRCEDLIQIHERARLIDIVDYNSCCKVRIVRAIAAVKLQISQRRFGRDRGDTVVVQNLCRST